MIWTYVVQYYTAWLYPKWAFHDTTREKNERERERQKKKNKQTTCAYDISISKREYWWTVNPYEHVVYSSTVVTAQLISMLKKGEGGRELFLSPAEEESVCPTEG